MAVPLLAVLGAAVAVSPLLEARHVDARHIPLDGNMRETDGEAAALASTAAAAQEATTTALPAMSADRDSSYLDELEELKGQVETSVDHVSAGLSQTYQSVESSLQRARSGLKRMQTTFVQLYKDAPGRTDPLHPATGLDDGRLWMQLTVASTMLWGFWGLLGGVAQTALPADTVFAWHCVGVLLSAGTFSPVVGFRLPVVQLLLSVASGAAYGKGSVCLIDAMTAGGSTAVVVVITSMYPLITLVLNTLVLQESPTIREGFGCCIAVVVILLMAEKGHGPEPSHSGAPKPVVSGNWAGSAVGALFGFGLWSFGAEVCAVHAGPSTMWQALGCALACYPRFPADAPDWYAPLKLGTRVSPTAGVAAAAGMGICMAAGTAAFMQACAYAPRLDPVVMLTSMYGLVTALLSRIFLDCRFCARQYMGMALVPFAILLLQGQT